MVIHTVFYSNTPRLFYHDHWLLLLGMANFRLKYNDFYQKYKNTVLFNKNLILSGIAAFFAGAVFTQLYAEQGFANNNDDLLNAISTLSVEYGVYIPLFAVLFHLDNRYRYIHPITGQKNSTQINFFLQHLQFLN